MFKYIAALLVVQALTGLAQAQQATSTTQVPQIQSAPAVSLSGGIKSYNVLGRGREMDDPTGRRLKSRNEMSLGLKSLSGWGLSGMLVETAQVKGDAAKNTFSPSDPSLTLSHPIFKSDSFSLSGALRQYFPVSDRSVTDNTWQSAYYLTAAVKLKNSWDFTNIIIPRYFSQSKYKAEDTKFYTAMQTYVAKKTNSWLRVGLGQISQAEFHANSPTGFVTDVYPYVDIMLSNQVYFGPRVYLPVAISGSVSDSAKKAALSEAQAELYLQATL